MPKGLDCEGCPMHDELVDKVNRLSKIMDGNGSEGLVTRISNVSIQLHHVESNLKEVRATMKELDSKTTKIMLIGVAAAWSLGSAGGSIIKLFTP